MLIINVLHKSCVELFFLLLHVCIVMKVDFLFYLSSTFLMLNVRFTRRHCLASWFVYGVRCSDLVMTFQKVQMLKRIMGSGGLRGEVGAGGGCIADEIGAERQLQYICLVLTHVAFDFQCEVQKSFIMTQLLKDVCTCMFSPLVKEGWRVGGFPSGLHRWWLESVFWKWSIGSSAGLV